MIARSNNLHKELKLLLKKYNAELVLLDFSDNHTEDNKIVVNFLFNKDNHDDYTPQLVLGYYEDGDF